MERFTQEEALKEIFSVKKLSAVMNVYKHRYNNAELAQKSIDKILKDNNYIVIQQALYVKA